MAMLPVQAPPEQGSIHEIRPRLTGSPLRGLAGRSDERLVSTAKDGDERAFEILYERHSPAIHRYCRSLLRSTQEAEDVKQEVFVLAISALRRGAHPEAFRPWLYRVAHNACMSHLRTRRPVLVADNGVLVGPAAAEPVEHHREELRQLLDDIGRLPDVQRGALLLREMDGFSYEQVGEVLGLPLSTVRSSIFRARRTLQGLAEARDADCEVIQSELCELADRRGRRGRHITSHLAVCSNCREFRDALRRRPAVLSGMAPVGPLAPGGLLLALKGKLLGGATAGGGTGTALATAGGGAGAAKIAAVAASSIAILAGAGVEADRVIDHGRRAAATPRHTVISRAARTAPAATARPLVAGAAAATAPGTDTIREGGVLTADRANASSTGSRARAHAREDEGSAAHSTGASATAPPADAAPAAETTSSIAGAREHEPGETTSAGVHGRHRGSDGDETRRDDAATGGSGRSGSDSAAGADNASPHSATSGEGPSSGASLADDVGEASDTPSPNRSANAGPSPAQRPVPTQTGAGTTPQASGGTPAPAPAPSAVPPPDPAPPDDPAPEPPAGDVGAATATAADPSAVTVLPQP